jgi:dual specificity tyrosine-phosphorylation-regulated kinase 2/3/4
LAELYTGKVLFHNNSIPSMLARIISICGKFDKDILSNAKFTKNYFIDKGIVFERDEDGEINFLIPKRTSLKLRLNNLNDKLFLDFIKKCIETNPKNRLSSKEALGKK